METIQVQNSCEFTNNQIHMKSNDVESVWQIENLEKDNVICVHNYYVSQFRSRQLASGEGCLDMNVAHNVFRGVLEIKTHQGLIWYLDKLQHWWASCSPAGSNTWLRLTWCTYKPSRSKKGNVCEKTIESTQEHTIKVGVKVHDRCSSKWFCDLWRFVEAGVRPCKVYTNTHWKSCYEQALANRLFV
jgi:hypothetical protein